MTDPVTPPRTPLPLVPLLLLALVLTACGGDGPDGEAGDAGGAADDPAAAGDVTEGPPGPDIWVGEIVTEGDSVRITGLRNATRRSGYDNQPAFIRQGDAFLYTRADGAGRTDIWRYDVREDRAEPVTRTTPESEYSPTPLPQGNGFSTVRVEADSTQRLWRFPPSGENPSVLFPDVAPVGYHAWAGEEWAVMFVLGDPPTLVVAGGESSDTREVARDVGRSIRSIPGETAVSFVQRLPHPEGAEGATDAADADDPADTTGAVTGDAAPERAVSTRFMRWDPIGGVSPITDAPGGEDDHAWTPGGVLLVASGPEILAWREGRDGWRVAGRAPDGGTVSRMAVSPDGRRIAVVIETPDPG